MSYNKKIWKNGDLITKEGMNNIENGIYMAHDEIEALKNNTPTGGSNINDTTASATTTYSSNKIENIKENLSSQIEAISGETTGTSKVEPKELDMPKVFFYGTTLPTSKTDVNLTMDYISNTTKFTSFVKLKCQGSSSMSYAKKNFTVSMFSDEARAIKLKKDFKGWGPQSKFCLKANYIDTTHTRNLSGARIAYDMVASRPDSAFKQQLLQCPRNGAVDGFPIKLYFNGEFYGIYTWNIPKDGWMFNMDKSNPNHVVLCAEENNDGTNTSDNVLRCEFRKEWDGTNGASWSIEFGTYSDALKNSFNRCVNFVMTATDEEFKANIGEYFDLYSLLDYYCFSYLVAHIDGLGKNMLMATYDGVVWGATLYDIDSIYGADWNGASFKPTNIQCPEQYQETNSLLWQRIESCFSTELYARYLELRQGALSLSNIIKHVEEIYDVIPDRVFIDEHAKWTSLPQVNTNTMTRFRNYMRDRAVYVDAQMQEIGTRVPCTGIVLGADTLSFTTTDTQTLSVVVSPDNCTDTVTWSVSPTGIVTVVDGVVTPIGNGECTITATCGSYSNTCTVNVALPSVECTGISLDKTELALGPGQTDTSSEETIDVTQNTTAGYIICGASEVNGNGGMSSFGKTKSSALDTATDFIPFTSNDTLTISQPSSQFGCVVVVYDSNKQGLACYTANNTWEAGNTQSSTELKSLTMDIPAPPSETAYIRISFNLTDLSDVTVVKKYTNSGVSSAQLTPTLTPANCTQPVVWSVSPEGIVTVDNGLVTAVANGEATVTATCGSYSDTCSVTVSGIGVNKVVNLWKSATWAEKYYDDDGTLTSFGTIHHSSLIPVNGKEIITVECDASITAPYLRLSYFNSDSEYIGYDRGGGYNTPVSTNNNSITVNLLNGLVNIAYVSINANTGDKSLLTVSSTDSNYSIIDISTSYVNGNLNRDSNAVTSGTAGTVTENSLDVTSDYINCNNRIRISVSDTTHFIGIVAYDENKEYLATYNGENKIWHSEGYSDTSRYSDLLITTFPDTAKYIRFTVGGCTNSSLITVKTCG